MSATWERLEDQIAWYDRKSQVNQRTYKRVKVIQIVLAALVPVLATIDDAPRWTIGAMGAAVVILESVQQLFQYHQNWITYRATCEGLKHEKFLFQAHAGPYAGALHPDALLADRVEGLVSQEHAKWTSSREQVVRVEAEGAAAAAEPAGTGGG